jgi:hypothetical protein
VSSLQDLQHPEGEGHSSSSSCTITTSPIWHTSHCHSLLQLQQPLVLVELVLMAI